MTCTKRLISVCSVEYNGIIGRVSNFGLMTYVVLRLIIEGNKDKRIRCVDMLFSLKKYFLKASYLEVNKVRKVSHFKNVNHF